VAGFWTRNSSMLDIPNILITEYNM
jgi:hypothetical protein